MHARFSSLTQYHVELVINGLRCQPCVVLQYDGGGCIAIGSELKSVHAPRPQQAADAAPLQHNPRSGKIKHTEQFAGILKLVEVTDIISGPDLRGCPVLKGKYQVQWR